MVNIEENNSKICNSDSFSSNEGVDCRSDNDMIMDKWKTYIMYSAFVALISAVVSNSLAIYVEFYNIVPTAMISSYLIVPCIILMVLGALFSLVAVFAFRSAKYDNMVHLKWSARAVLLLMLISLGTASYVCSTSFFSSSVETENLVLKEAIEIYQYPAIMNRVDSIQKRLQCCGMDSIDDWNLNDYYYCGYINQDDRQCSVPNSCCVSTQGSPLSSNCGKDVLNISSPLYVRRKKIVYVEGCQEKIELFLSCTAKELLYSFVFLIICQFLVYKCSAKIMTIFEKELNTINPPNGYLPVASKDTNEDLYKSFSATVKNNYFF